MKGMIKGFSPVIRNDAKVVIFGSMPSRISLKKKEYYGHVGNHFWKVISSVLKEDVPIKYEDKKRMLKEHCIGLWDVIYSCRREGSNDSDIVDPRLNDIDVLLKKYSGLRLICFNGRTAEDLFKKRFGHISIKTIYLPSTSPLCRVKIEEKIRIWKKALGKVIK